jgi:hypothetical protein
VHLKLLQLLPIRFSADETDGRRPVWIWVGVQPNLTEVLPAALQSLKPNAEIVFLLSHKHFLYNHSTLHSLSTGIYSLVHQQRWLFKVKNLWLMGRIALFFKIPIYSKLLYDWRSVMQYVLISSTVVGLATRYYFLPECWCLKFIVLFLWGTFSDERTGLQFAV